MNVMASTYFFSSIKALTCWAALGGIIVARRIERPCSMAKATVTIERAISPKAM